MVNVSLTSLSLSFDMNVVSIRLVSVSSFVHMFLLLLDICWHVMVDRFSVTLIQSGTESELVRSNERFEGGTRGRPTDRLTARLGSARHGTARHGTARHDARRG